MTTTLSIRMDEDLKADAEEFFSDIGMNMTTAITCFFKKCLDVGEIPFKLGRKSFSAVCILAFRKAVT